jgi:hypothetical protein
MPCSGSPSAAVGAGIVNVWCRNADGLVTQTSISESDTLANWQYRELDSAYRVGLAFFDGVLQAFVSPDGSSLLRYLRRSTR